VCDASLVVQLASSRFCKGRFLAVTSAICTRTVRRLTVKTHGHNTVHFFMWHWWLWTCCRLYCILEVVFRCWCMKMFWLWVNFVVQFHFIVYIRNRDAMTFLLMMTERCRPKKASNVKKRSWRRFSRLRRTFSSSSFR